MVSRCRWAQGTPVPRSLRRSDNVQIADTPIQSQLDFQPEKLPRSDFADCISPATAAKVPCSSEMFSRMAHCKEPNNGKEDLTKLLNDYKIHLQNANHDIIKKDNMLPALGAKVSCLQKAQEKLKAENKSLILVNAEHVKKAKKVPVRSSKSSHEKVTDSIPKHLLGLSTELESEIPS